MNNIAEGFERKSNKEFRQYLYIAKGSCGEVRSMLYLANDLKKISEKDFQTLYNLSQEISTFNFHTFLLSTHSHLFHSIIVHGNHRFPIERLSNRVKMRITYRFNILNCPN